MTGPGGHACLVCCGCLGPSKLPGLLACGACGFITADLDMAEQELERLYGESYFFQGEYADYLADWPVAVKNFQRRLFRLLPHVRHPENCRLLEIGCAHGVFLSIAKGRFREVEGIDISAPAISHAAKLGLNVTRGDFLTTEVPPGVDVACLWDTIEHLSRPDLYVDKLAALMPPGAILAITTGDIGSFAARVRGRKWRQIHPPTHLHYFSRATLTTLLERRGFVVRDCIYDGNYRSLDMIANLVLAKRNGMPRLYSLLKQLHLLDWDIYGNLYDIAFIIAERKAVGISNAGRPAAG